MFVKFNAFGNKSCLFATSTMLLKWMFLVLRDYGLMIVWLNYNFSLIFDHPPTQHCKHRLWITPKEIYVSNLALIKKDFNIRFYTHLEVMQNQIAWQQKEQINRRLSKRWCTLWSRKSEATECGLAVIVGCLDR